jgi:hypothetical protein
MRQQFKKTVFALRGKLQQKRRRSEQVSKLETAVQAKQSALLTVMSPESFYVFKQRVQEEAAATVPAVAASSQRSTSSSYNARPFGCDSCNRRFVKKASQLKHQRNCKNQ